MGHFYCSELLSELVELPTVAQRFKREESFLAALLPALLCTRGLVLGNRECCARLHVVVTALHEGSPEHRRRFMAACVSSMRIEAEGRASDGRALIFLCIADHGRPIAGPHTLPSPLLSSSLLI